MPCAMWTLIRDGVEKVTIKQTSEIFFEYNNASLALADDALWVVGGVFG